MADANSDSSNAPLTFVACVSDEDILRANLLSSPCLARGSVHELILIRNCQSAAEGLNRGIARAGHEFVVCLLQDVHLPTDWDQRLIRQLDSAARQCGPIGVAGVYGVGEPSEVRPEAPLDATGPAAHHPPQLATDEKPKYSIAWMLGGLEPALHGFDRDGDRCHSDGFVGLGVSWPSAWTVGMVSILADLYRRELGHSRAG